jgi:hypothetical protein
MHAAAEVIWNKLLAISRVPRPHLPPAGPESFINTFDAFGPGLELPGATIGLVSAGQVYGANVAGTSAVLVRDWPAGLPASASRAA